MRSTHTAQDFHAGETVRLAGGKFTGEWEVEGRPGRVNCSVVQRDGNGNVVRRIKPCAPVFMWKLDETIPAEPIGRPALRTYVAGEFVKVAAPGQYHGIWMVMRDNGKRLSAARPGGDGGRYASLGKGALEPLTKEQAIKELAAAL